MAAEIPEITDSNQDHMLCDLHECLKILHRIDKLLTEFEPVMAQFRSPLASRMTRRKINDQGQRNGNG